MPGQVNDNGTTLSAAPLDPLELRRVWPHEALDLTPWMIKAEPLARLGRAIGIGPIEAIAREYGVGEFSADILARDPWGGPVIIENQLEPSDHKHLGQAITYLAGIPEGATVIWVAARIRPEHAAALQWLNERTPPSIGFYGVELGLWTIAGSAPGYDFRVVVKPEAHKLAGREETGGPLTAEGMVLQGYWLAFRDFLDARGADHWIRSDLPKSNWWGRNLGSPGFNLYAVVKPAARMLSVLLEISSSDHAEIFARLSADRDGIDARLGEAVRWSSTEARDYVSVECANMDVSDKNEWPKQHEWLLSHLERFRETFVDRFFNFASDPTNTVGGKDGTS